MPNKSKLVTFKVDALDLPSRILTKLLGFVERENMTYSVDDHGQAKVSGITPIQYGQLAAICHPPEDVAYFI